MRNFNDQSLYSKGLEQFKKNQLDNSLNFLLNIKKNLNTFKLISQIYIKKMTLRMQKYLYMKS